MNFKNLILSVKSANAKFRNKFDAISKISANILIFGQLTVLVMLSAALFYALYVNSNVRSLIAGIDVFDSVQVLFENAASGACTLWLCAIFIDYIEKGKKQDM